MGSEEVNLNYRKKTARLDLEWCNKYRSLTTEEIIKLVQNNNDQLALEYLLRKNQYLVFSIVKNKFSKLGTREDLMQEGMLGLVNAIYDYDFESNLSVINFMYLCIKRKLITRLRWENRVKHNLLNDAVSYNKKECGRNSDRKLIDILDNKDKIDNPLEIVVNNDSYREVINFFKHKLTNLEFDVLEGYLEGRSYEEIAREIGRKIKSVDNALQRVRKKLKTFLTKKNRCKEIS